MFARFDEIPSLPVQNIKEKPKRHGWTDRQVVKTVYPCKHSLRGRYNHWTAKYRSLTYIYFMRSIFVSH